MSRKERSVDKSVWVTYQPLPKSGTNIPSLTSELYPGHELDYVVHEPTWFPSQLVVRDENVFCQPVCIPEPSSALLVITGLLLIWRDLRTKRHETL